MSELIENFAKAFSRMRNRRSHITEKKLLSIAEDDLKASEILYKQGLYSQATYHLAQCVEKAAKAFALSFGIITGDELKRLGHRTPRAFLKILDESEIGELAKALTQQYAPKATVDTTDYRHLVYQEPLKIARMSYEEIRLLLDTLQKIEKDVTNSLSSILGLFQKMLPNSDIPELFSKIPTDFVGLWLIASITFPHQEYTRYFDPKLAIDPSEYTEEMGIVKALPRLIETTKRCIDTTSRYVCIVS